MQYKIVNESGRTFAPDEYGAENPVAPLVLKVPPVGIPKSGADATFSPFPILNV